RRPPPLGGADRRAATSPRGGGTSRARAPPRRRAMSTGTANGLPPGKAESKGRSMVGIVVVGHGRLGEEMVQTLEGVLGPIDAVVGGGTTSHDPPGDNRAPVERAAPRVEQGPGVLLPPANLRQ